MAQSSGRQKVRLRRLIGTLSSTSLPELARQTKEGFDSLVTGINDAVAGFALRIIDGTVTPPRPLPDREKLQFGGDLDVSTTKDRHIISVTLPAPGVTDHGALTGLGDNDHTQYANAAIGYDGVTSTLAGQTVTTRRDQTTISISTSGAFNDWAPAAGWRTTRVLLFNPTGFTVINGFDAPSGANDTLERECWNTSTSTEFDISHDSGSNSSVTSRVLCPDNLDFRVRPRSGWWMRWDTVASRWRITATSQDHGRLRGLTDDDHTQYILVAGTRAFTGDQSMGNNDLTSVGGITMTSGGAIAMSGGDITGFDDLVADGSGSSINMASGTIFNVAYQELEDGMVGAGDPSVDNMYISTVKGHPHFRMGVEAFPHTGFVAARDFQTAWNTGTALADFEIDFSDIDGKDLTDGAYEIHGWAFICDNSSGTTSYYEHRIWHCVFVSGASTSVTISERLFDGVAFHMDGRGPVYSASASGQVATFTRNTVFGSSIRLHHYIVVYGMGGV